ncbi:hypothetical protein BDN72DRAFT_877579 [Pluteus cervinus]|uniref:Uncharacterized protein n=1 Tax=Pluteus cervinus TaxID=181527 RepID=A0ACD3AYF4_9AGAR|nr:hypothetical protein BDN72DRAFT_877579 [Pluteus cervinus]
MEDARQLLSAYVSQICGYEIQLEQGNTLVVCRNGNLLDLYRRLQAHALRTPLIDHPSNPYRLPRPHSMTWIYVDLKDLIAVFAVVSMKGPMALHPDPPFLKYSLLVKRAILRTPFADLAKGGEFDQLLEKVSKLSKKVKQGLAGLAFLRAEEHNSRVLDDISGQLDYLGRRVQSFRSAVMFSVGNEAILSIEFRREVREFFMRCDLQAAICTNQFREVSPRIDELERRDRIRQDYQPSLADHQDFFRLAAFQALFVLFCSGVFTSILHCIFASGPALISAPAVLTVIDSASNSPDGVIHSISTSQLTTLPHDHLPPFSRGDGYRIALEI